jgi:hypothetical protein
MYKILIIEIIINIMGFITCLSSIFSLDWFIISSSSKTNITGKSIGLYEECIYFENGTNECSIYSCSNTSELKKFCEDIIGCRYGMIISTIAFLSNGIISLIRIILICNIDGWEEGICTHLSIFFFGLFALFQTGIGIGYGTMAMSDFIKINPTGFITSTFGSGYYMVIISFIFALICLLHHCIFCCTGSHKNQTKIRYNYLPNVNDEDYNLLLQDDSNPPPIYSAKACVL